MYHLDVWVGEELLWQQCQTGLLLCRKHHPNFSVWGKCRRDWMEFCNDSSSHYGNRWGNQERSRGDFRLVLPVSLYSLHTFFISSAHFGKERKWSKRSKLLSVMIEITRPCILSLSVACQFWGKLVLNVTHQQWHAPSLNDPLIVCTKRQKASSVLLDMPWKLFSACCNCFVNIRALQA